MNDHARAPASAAERAMEDYLFELFDEPSTPAVAAFAVAAVFDCAGVRIGLDRERLQARFALSVLDEAPAASADAALFSALHAGQELRLLDVAARVLPADLPRRSMPLAQRCPEVVMLDGERGLLPGLPTGEQSVDGEHTRWREPCGSRPWLVGLDRAAGIVLLDLDALFGDHRLAQSS
ncbi:MAG: hypothetical protein RQ729_05095 [Wenzhouxiangellaceae bacterium]|nr:hypothetical protein [Wenzhouxiangellaceae bacterium]